MSHYSAYPPPGVYLPAAVAGRTRPGIVTAIGVVGIIVASISLITGFVSGLMILGRYSISTAAANKARSMTSSAGGIGASSIGGPATNPAGLPTPLELSQQEQAQRGQLEFRRDALARLFASLRPMTAQQQKNLAALLGQSADKMLPQNILQAAALSPTDLQEQVSSSGTLTPTRPDDPAPVYFELKTGRLEVFTDSAVFRPADGSPRLRASAAPGAMSLAGLQLAVKQSPPAPASSPTTNPTTFYRSGLNEAEVATVLQTVQNVLSGQPPNTPLNGPQLATLRSELQNTLPPIVDKNRAYAPLSLAQVQPDGSALLKLTNAVLVIDPSGTVTQKFSMSIHEVVFDPVVGVLLIGEFAGSTLLAIFLIIASIAVLRDYRRGAGLMWIYALLKVPVAIVGGVVFVWGVQQLVHSIAKLNSTASSSADEGFRTFGIVMTVLSCIFPVVLMIVLSTGTVRSFFAAQRARPA
jgi:hypothetical protein